MSSFSVGSVKSEQKIDCSVSQVRAQYGVAPFIQGPPGNNGTNGTNGIDGVSPPQFPGFGQITYSHTPISNGDFIDAGNPIQLMFLSDFPPMDYLNDCFKGHSFWDGSKIVSRALYDLLEVQVNLQIKSQVSGGFIQVYLDSQSSIGPIVSSTATLFSPANVLERVTFLLNFQSLQNSLLNGTRIYARSTVPLYIFKETLLIIPRSTHSA